MLRHLRTLLPIALLAGVVSAGCLFISGQFIITYDFKEHGYDPLTVNSASAVAGVPVDLTGISTYKDHKKELKDVADLALVGQIQNLDVAQPVTVEVWMVASGGTLLTTDTAIRAAGKRVWGPLTIPAGGTTKIGWNDSAKLFVGRQLLVNEIKGDGQFDLYVLGNNGYHFQVTKAALIAVIAAGK